MLILRLRTLAASAVFSSVTEEGNRLVEDPKMASCKTLRHVRASVCSSPLLPSWFFTDALAATRLFLGARVAALMGAFQMLDGLERRVGIFGIRRFPATGGLASDVAILTKLFPEAQEDLEGLCQDLHFWQKEALVTLHGPKPARLGGGVAVAPVLPALQWPSSEVAKSPSKFIAAFFVGVRATRMSLLIFASGAEVLSWSDSRPRDVKHIHKLRRVLTMSLTLSDTLPTTFFHTTRPTELNWQHLTNAHTHWRPQFQNQHNGKK